MTGRPRAGRNLSGRVSVEIGKRKKPCPVCGAAIGWRCTKTVGLQVMPRAKDHKERR